MPFGEYLPFRTFWNRSGSPVDQKLRGGFSAGPGLRTIEIAGLPPFAPLVCYEIVFPGRVVDRAHPPQWMLNVTNDAWYGMTPGPWQHLHQARLRAVEEGCRRSLRQQQYFGGRRQRTPRGEPHAGGPPASSTPICAPAAHGLLTLGYVAVSGTHVNHRFFRGQVTDAFILSVRASLTSRVRSQCSASGCGWTCSDPAPMTR